jgi:hypothetical protein
VSGDGHVRFHDLLAERLDTTLEAADDAALSTHLADCASCRVVERDYAAQRQQLRALGPVEAPRDLWARTRTALDHEIARDGRRARPAPALPTRRSGGVRQLRVAVGSLVGVLVVLLVAGGPLLQRNPIAVPAPTSFPIAPESFAFVDIADGTATLYRTDVAQACPPTNVDCRSGPESLPVVRFAAGFAAQQMALGGNGQVFVASRDLDGGEVFAIVDLATDGGPKATPSPTPGATDQGGKPTASPDPDATLGSPSTRPSVSAPPSTGVPLTAEARPILTGVRGAGAPAAWSPDGSILAFSAVPADRSHGSDIYIWRPGDDVAVPLTTDHRSIFASWSGARIVVSRTTLADPKDPAAPVTSETVVIDPGSAEERPVDLADSWLPSVDPTRHWVVYWKGRLAAVDGVITPEAGELLVADWAAIDPWAADDAAANPSSAPDGSAKPGTESAPPTSRPTTKPVPTGAKPTASAGRTATAKPAVTNAGDATDTPAGASRVPVPTDSPAVPDRPDGVSGDTVDWVVRWAADGAAFGVWTASGHDQSTAGWLTVRSEPSAESPAGDLLLGPNSARRSFALGADRVVWVTPLANGDGELWMATWGIDGSGTLRIRNLDSAEAVPAF